MKSSKIGNKNNGRPREKISRSAVFFRLYTFSPSDEENITLSFSVNKTVFQIKNAIQTESEPHRTTSRSRKDLHPEILPPTVGERVSQIT
jgi:hypothetical protein